MMREIQYNQAIKEAIAEEMERDEKVFVLGEGGSDEQPEDHGRPGG